MGISGDIRICFVGDSFIQGTGDETALGWTGRLCVDAHRRGSPVTGYNLGICRDISRDILMRWESESRRRLPENCDGRMVVSCGVNDTAFEYGHPRVSHEDSLANVRQILQAASRYPLVLVGPPPVNDGVQNRRIDALSRGYSQIAAAAGVSYIGLYKPLAEDEIYMNGLAVSDGAHPDSRGHAKMADIIAASPHWWFHAA